MTDTEDTDTTEYKRSTTTTGKEKEVLVIRDTGIFKHETGDVYDGFFEVKKKDKTFKMYGPGTYMTNEGDTYTCNWENDRPTQHDEVTIAYHDGHKFEGYLKDFCYSGPGKYVYPDESVLSCSFAENCPVGMLTLTDPNGHAWTATAGQGSAWFEPTNHYYDLLSYEKVHFPAKVRRVVKKEDLETSPSRLAPAESSPKMKKSKKK